MVDPASSVARGSTVAAGAAVQAGPSAAWPTWAACWGHREPIPTGGIGAAFSGAVVIRDDFASVRHVVSEGEPAPPEVPPAEWEAAAAEGKTAEDFNGAAALAPLGQEAATWRMYYYGRDSDSWSRGVKPPGSGVPTGLAGCIGMARAVSWSEWSRFRGPLPGGAVFDPSADEAAFDAVQVAVSDVIRLPPPLAAEDQSWGWKIFYVGSGLEFGEVPDLPGTMLPGVRMRPGSATSADGVHFERSLEPVLPLGNAADFDALGVAWPRVKPPSNYYTSESALQTDGAGQWLLTYHTRERATGGRGACFSAGVATSPDGKLWVKQGKVLTRGPEGAWDDGGVSVRSCDTGGEPVDNGLRGV